MDRLDRGRLQTYAIFLGQLFQGLLVILGYSQCHSHNQ